jgi:hypothetical protein
MFGIVTIVAGVLGVVAGSFMGQKLRIRFPSAGKILFVSFWKFTFQNYIFIVFLDAIICGVGMLCSAPFFYAVLVLALGPLWVIYILCFIALWFINLNWALVGDILLVSFRSSSNYP